MLTTAQLCCPLLSWRKWIDGWNLCLQTDMLGHFLFISNTLQSLAGACLQITNKTHKIIIFFKRIRSLLAPVSFWYYTGHCNPLRLLVSRWSYECDHWDALTVITIKHAVYLLNRTSYCFFSVLFMIIIKNAPADTLAEIHWLLYSHLVCNFGEQKHSSGFFIYLFIYFLRDYLSRFYWMAASLPF